MPKYPIIMRTYTLTLKGKHRNMRSSTILEPNTPEYRMASKLALIFLKPGLIYLDDIVYWAPQADTDSHFEKYQRLYEYITGHRFIQ